MNRLVTIIMLLVFSASLPSCSFYRFVTGKKKGEGKKIVLAGTDSAGAPLPLASHDSAVAFYDSTLRSNILVKQFTPVWRRRLDFKTFSGKAKMRYEGPDSKHEFTAHVRVKKDSIIWIQVTAALGGIPVARIVVTRDSFLMRNDIDNEGTMLPLSKAVRILPGNVDYASLQNLIMGEPLRDGILTDARSYADSFTIRVEDSSYLQLITFNGWDSSMRQGVLRTRNPLGPEAVTEYGKYEVDNGRRISTLRFLNLRNGNDTYLLDMNFTKSVFDEPQQFPFSIPKSYTIKQ